MGRCGQGQGQGWSVGERAEDGRDTEDGVGKDDDNSEGAQWVADTHMTLYINCHSPHNAWLSSRQRAGVLGAHNDVRLDPII